MSETNKQTDPNEALADEWAAALDEQEDVVKGRAKVAKFDELED